MALLGLNLLGSIMRRRFFALLTAGALIFSSLIFGTSVAQAADTTGSISGTVKLPSGYTFDQSVGYNGVTAYEVTTSDGSQELSWSSSASLDKDGNYTFDDLVAGHSYVIAADADSINVTPATKFLTTVYKNLGTTDDYYSWDLSKVTPVKATAAGVKGINFTMALGATVTGTVQPSGITNPGVMVCEIRNASNDPYLDCQYPTVTDNTYSATVAPGSQVVVEAWADDYLYTWLGGLATANQYDYSLPDNLNDGSMTTLTAPAKGKELKVDDITVTKASSISGTIVAPSGTKNVQVQVCTVTSSGSNCQGTPVTKGSYSTNVAPGTKVVIYAYADGYLFSYLDGTVQSGDYADITASSITPLAIPAEGETLTDQDITLVKAASVSGTVKLPDGYSLDKTQTRWSAVTAYEVGSDGTLDGTTSSADLSPSGKYTINRLVPGNQYIVGVTANNLYASPSTGLLNTAFGGYASNVNPGNWDPTATGIQLVTADEKGTTADITMKTGAIITGTITPNDPDVNVQVCEVNQNQSLDPCQYYITVDADGNYSATVTPGSTAVVYATAPGYLYTWLGTYSSSSSYNYDLTNSAITQIQTSADGGTYDKNDITLAKAYTISGTVKLPSGYTFDSSNYGYVTAYTVDDSGSTPQTSYVQQVSFSADGAYTFDKLTAGKYLISVDAYNLSVSPRNDFMTTLYGGYASRNWDLTDKTIKFVTVGPDSADGIDITMVKGGVISTKVTPADAQNVYVSVCEVATDGTTQSMNYCQGATDDGDGNYTAIVTPGATAVIEAKADGYVYTWLGGYLSSSDLTYGYVVSQMTQVTAPSTQNTIDLQKATTISGTVTLPEGYTFTNANYGSNFVRAYQVVTSDNGTQTLSGNTVSGSISATDGTYTISVVPGTDWMIVVEANGLNVAPTNDFVSTAYGQYTSTNGPYSWNPTSDGITLVHADAAGATDINIDMQTGFVIKGTITPKVPSGTYIDLEVCPLDSQEDDLGYCVSPNVDSKGNYSATLASGSTAVVYASAPGYFYTWFGGYTSGQSYSYDLTSDQITKITDPGTPVTADIELAKASSISGAVTLPTGYTWQNSNYTNVQVLAYEVTTASDGTQQLGASYSAWTAKDGSYTIDKLTPGKQYIVAAYASNLAVNPSNDFLNTAHGGYASLNSPYNWDPASKGIDAVNLTATPATGVNIAMSKGDIVSGTVYPTNATNIQVRVCEVTAATQLMNVCTSATVTDGKYSAAVTSGAVVVIEATADNYLYTWYGTYSDSSDGTYGSVNEGAFQVRAPTSGRDITLVNGVAISGKVTLPSGYKLDPDYSGYVQASEVLRNDDGTMSLDSVASGRISADGTYRISGLKPDTPYVVWVSPQSLDLSQGATSDLLTVAYGGYVSTTSLYNVNSTDLMDPLIGRVTLTAGQTKTVNLAIPVSGKITGTVYMPDGTTPVDPSIDSYVYCMSVDDYNNGYYYSSYSEVASNGTYSCTVVPGKAYVVRVGADGYPTVWRGQFVGSNPTLPDNKVTQITAPASGKSVTAQDITLVGGSSISGKLIYEPDTENPYAYVIACTLDANGNQGDCASTADIGTDGSYTINGLIPNATVVVEGYATGYMTTWYGQVISNNPDMTTLKTVTTAAAGKTVTGVNIQLGKPFTITGTVSPSSVYATSGLYVFACPAYAESGQGYYKTMAGNTSRGHSAMPSNGSQRVDALCTAAWVRQGSDGTYSMSVAPGVDYVVVAQASGYNDAWFGGYIGDSGIVWDQASDARVLPADGYTLVVGKAGATQEHVDITFGQSVTVTFDAGDGLPTMLTRVTPVGSTVTLPSNPTRDGYVFGGWYTEANGAGSKFTADSVVDATQTVYANWVQNVTPYTVTFMDGQGNTLSVVQVVPGGAATPPENPTRTGYIFKGWDQKFDTVNADMTVTATWVEAVTYTVTFDANGGKGSMKAQSVNGGDTVKLDANAFTLDGKIFKEWNTAADGTGTACSDGGSLTVKGNVTLYAQWKDAATFTVTFVDGLGHTWEMQVQEGQAATAPADPVRDGYTFSGWDTAFNDVRSDLTINAVWTSNTPEEKIPAPTGGTSVGAPASSGYLLILAAGCVLAGLLVQRLSTRHSAKRG